MNRHKIFGRFAVAGAALFLSLLLAYPASAVTPTTITGTGSDVTWRVMNNLDALYNLSPGCNVLQTPSQTALDESCQAPLPGQTIVTTENSNHDMATEDVPIGGTAGVSQLCSQGLAGVGNADYARQTNPISGTTCANLRFVAYARDALDFEYWGGATFSGFHNTNTTCNGSAVGVVCLTQAQLQGIFTCSITNWNQVGGQSSVPIKPYSPLPQFGTRTKWDSFLGGISEGGCVTQTPAETDNSFVVANGDQAGAIQVASFGSWTSRYKKVPAGTKLGLIDKVTPTAATITSGAFPFSRFIYNVYFYQGAHVANAATQSYVGEHGWICKGGATGVSPFGHSNVPYVSPAQNYHTAITKAITTAGFVALKFGNVGGGDPGKSFCLMTHT
jgi:PBP superfamily domain